MSSNFTRAVRERMEMTGEKYTTALINHKKELEKIQALKKLVQETADAEELANPGAAYEVIRRRTPYVLVTK